MTTMLFAVQMLLKMMVISHTRRSPIGFFDLRSRRDENSRARIEKLANAESSGPFGEETFGVLYYH